MQPSAFHTRSRANEGRKFFLSLPDGTKTEEWLQVYGCDADPVVLARAKYRGLAVDNASQKTAISAEIFADQNKFVVLVPAVKAWSFDVPLTEENVREFLSECPHIADEVERLVYDRTGFFASISNSSLPVTSEPTDSKPE